MSLATSLFKLIVLSKRIVLGSKSVAKLSVLVAQTVQDATLDAHLV